METRVSAQAFIDESARGSSYHVCVAVVANGDVESLRRVVRSFCLPGQRRWHFVNERDSRRKQIIDAIVHSGQVSALAYYGTGRDNDLRAESFRRMVQPLLDRGVTRLIIESRQGRDDLDRQVLIDQLRRHGTAGFDYAHLPPTPTRCCGSQTHSPGALPPAGPGEIASPPSRPGRTSPDGRKREARPLTVRRGAGLTS